MITPSEFEEALAELEEEEWEEEEKAMEAEEATALKTVDPHTQTLCPIFCSFLKFQP